MKDEKWIVSDKDHLGGQLSGAGVELESLIRFS